MANNTPLKTLEGFRDIAGADTMQHKIMLQLMDLQFLNNFEVIFTPTHLDMTTLKKTSGGELSKIAEQYITRLYLQSIQVSFNSVEVNNASTVSYAKGLEPVSTCTMTFLEDDKSTTRSFFIDWMDKIYYIDPITKEPVFRDNQQATYRDVRILVKNGLGIVNPVWVKISGLRPTKLGDISLAQNSAEALILTVNFAFNWIDYTII